MTILATYNIKGGVGKTAAAVNLAYLAAQAGARTLIWDLDPQGAATFYFRVKPKVKGGGKGLVNKSRPAGDLIKGTDYPQLDLLPADFSYRHLDIHLDEMRKPTRALHKILKPLRDEYDYVFLDCPPSISLVSEARISTESGRSCHSIMMESAIGCGRPIIASRRSASNDLPRRRSSSVPTSW